MDGVECTEDAKNIYFVSQVLTTVRLFSFDKESIFCKFCSTRSPTPCGWKGFTLNYCNLNGVTLILPFKFG